MDNNTDNKVNNIGKRLKELRAERNLTLDYLAGITDTRTPAELQAHKKRAKK